LTVPKVYINYIFQNENFKYVSNESNFDVFFDNLQVIRKPGPILEAHYYPFGLTMAGISSKAAGGLENKYKYNGIELDTSLGLDEYEATLRDLDPQTGRWWQVDPETEDEEMWSPYTSNNDNPILYKDPRGNEGEACCGGFLEALHDAGDKILLSAGGVLFGSLNTISGGLIPSDPFHESNLPGDAGMYFRNGNMVGQLAPYMPVGPSRAPEATETVPVKLPSTSKLEPINPKSPEVSSKVQSTSNKQTGSYTNTHASEKTYSGKGSEQRAKVSAN
jgi:RHS repeat-associated protein